MLHLLLFVVLYLAFAIGSLILNPAFSFTLYEIVYFMNPADRWWSGPLPSIGYSFIVVALMMVVLVKNFKEHKLNNPLKIPQMRWMYVLLLLYSIASLYARLPDGHILALESYIKLQITMTIAFMLVTNIEKLKYYTYGYIFSAWYLSFYIYQQGRTSGERVEGIGTVDSPDSNGIAAAIAPTIVLALFYLWRSKNNFLKMAFAIAVLFSTNAIVLINSRGAFLGVAVSIMYFFCYLYFAKVRTSKQRLFAVALTFIGIIGFFKVADQSFLDRMSSITSESKVNEEQESGGTRMVFWGAAWDMTKDFPFGNGYRGFDMYAPFYIPQDVNTGKSRNRSVHSTWFETLTEVGYPGLLAFLLMIYSAFRTTRQCKKHLKVIGDTENYYRVVAIEAALISFLIAMTFLNRMRAEILYWLILYTACLHNIYLVKTTKKNDVQT
jgi:hypothetical protein